MTARGAPYSAGERALLAALFAGVGLVSLWPVARLVAEGLAPGGGFDLAILTRLYNSPATWRALWRTLDTSVCGTLVSLALGGAFAVVAALGNVRARGPLTFLFMLPLMIPAQITALAWINFLASGSPFLKLFGLAPAPGSPHPMFGRGGIILLLGIEHAPLVFLALRAGLRAMPRELIDAARAAGAGRFRVLRTIVLPLMIPALTAGALLAFVSSIGNFGAPALLGIPAGYDTLVTLLYQRLAGFGPAVLSEAAVLSLLIGLIALVGVLLQNRVLGRGDYRLIGGSMGAGASPFDLGRARLPVEIACWLAILVLVVVPFLALLASSLVPAVGVALTGATFTLRHYGAALFLQAATARAFANSLTLAASAALVAVAAALPLAYFLAWRSSRMARLLNPLVELPYALPGIVLAIGFILAFIRPLPIVGVSIYGTVWIILLAYVARFFALALRPVMSGFAQLDRTLDEAAASAGARLFRRMRTVTLPLVAPVAAAGALLVFLTALNELTVSALLWSRGTETLGVIVFSLQEGGDSPLAAAVSCVSIAVVLALMAFASLLASRLPDGVLPWAR
jgi:iron(III) transport system permease protein